MLRRNNDKGNGAKRTAVMEPRRNIIATRKGPMTQDQVDEMVRVKAYYIWEAAGKQGNAVDQWNQAKKEISRQLGI